ncbi:transcriptional regulator [Zunongwangia atlantica 22II14-10F7]|uniref:Transcriptional regulator n=2 Tax=Zunongwangia TaxID=417127 RepID=A0A1Y1T5T5_9FLAO|nr:transcriptional regulator [Zunongwangia atlantica 22II14-10F7]
MVSKGNICSTFKQEVSDKEISYLEVINVENQWFKMKKNEINFAEAESCPVRNILDRFGDKWSTLVILILGNYDKLRFNELQKMIGTVSQKMLAVTLKKLEADGLVTRKVYPQVPPKVEYSLTELGLSLLPKIESLVQWANENMVEITENRSLSEVK